MYSTKVVVALAVVAAASPALAYPSSASSDLYVRAAPASVATVDQSGAFTLGDIFKKLQASQGVKREEMEALMARAAGDESGAFALGDIFNSLRAKLGIKREEVEALMARAAQDESGAFNISDIFNTVKSVLGFKREEWDSLMARAAVDESGAFSFGDIFNGIKSVLGFKREDIESGAFSFGDIFNGIKSVLGFKRGELEALMARHLSSDVAARDLSAAQRQMIASSVLAHAVHARSTGADVDQSGALGIGSLIKFIPTAVNAISGLFNKREFEEIMARGTLTDAQRKALAVGLLSHAATQHARATTDADQSGALGIGSLIKFIPTAVSAISGLFNKREFEELMARGAASLTPGQRGALAAAMVAHATAHPARATTDVDESGALGLGSLVKFIPTAISAISGLFNNKREFDELVARGSLTDAQRQKLMAVLAAKAQQHKAARSINELD